MLDCWIGRCQVMDVSRVREAVAERNDVGVDGVGMTRSRQQKQRRRDNDRTSHDAKPFRLFFFGRRFLIQKGLTINRHCQVEEEAVGRARAVRHPFKVPRADDTPRSIVRWCPPSGRTHKSSVWQSFRIPLSLRMVEKLLPVRGSAALTMSWCEADSTGRQSYACFTVRHAYGRFTVGQSNTCFTGRRSYARFASRRITSGGPIDSLASAARGRPASARDRALSRLNACLLVDTTNTVHRPGR